MNIAHLRTFAEVMRQRSFAAVARVRNVDPSSISRDVAALENELGVRLFQRTTKRLAPTEAGVLYFGRIEPLLDELEQAAIQASETQTEPRGLLRIASPVSFALLVLVPILPNFARLYPDVQFDLQLTDHKIDLLEQGIDIAIRLSSEREKDIIAEPLVPMIASVCASPSYLMQYGYPKKPSDLSQHHCLALKLEGFGHRWRFTDQDGFNTEVPITPKLQTSNALALKHCALADMGIILQAQWVVQSELEQGKLINLFPNFTVTAALHETPFAWLLYPTRTYLPLRVKLFVEFIRQHFQIKASV